MFIDQNEPDVTITAGPGTATTLSTASFSFTANDFNATFQCKLDGGAYAACASGVSSSSYSGLTEDRHTFSVFATDVLGTNKGQSVFGSGASLLGRSMSASCLNATSRATL